MPAKPSFAARYPLLLYFAIAFTVSWGGILAIVAPSGIPAAPGQADGLFPYVYLAMLDALEHHSVEDLRALKSHLNLRRPDTG